MHANLALSLGFVLMLSAQLASAQTAKGDKPSLSYVIVIDQSPAQVVDVDLGASANKVVQLRPGYTLSLSRGADRTLLISELKTEDGRVLHKRQTRIGAAQKLKVGYLICNSQLTHISPAPPTMPKCQA
jgi:hypothetical protein